MNCKQGDVAIVVRSYTGREGAIVEVKRWIGESWTSQEGWVQDIWLVDCNGKGWMARDSQLRPIRDGEQPDELLTRIGKPETVSA